MMILYLRDAHIDAQIVLANIKVKLFVINAQLFPFGEFPFETFKKNRETKV